MRGVIQGSFLPQALDLPLPLARGAHQVLLQLQPETRAAEAVSTTATKLPRQPLSKSASAGRALSCMPKELAAPARRAPHCDGSAGADCDAVCIAETARGRLAQLSQVTRVLRAWPIELVPAHAPVSAPCASWRGARRPAP